jgi:GMP synthase-like glutamine amidotransferase
MSTVAIIDLHGQPHAHTQALVGLIRAAGVDVEIYDAHRGRMPATPDAVVITGGPDSPEASGPWRRRLQAAAEAWAKRAPVIAIGLGFEVIAQSHGWAVRPLEEDRTGWHAITPTAVGRADPLLKYVPRGAEVFEDRQWGVLPPPAATASRNVVLAFTSTGDVAAARFGTHTVGMIFHPEAAGGPENAIPPRTLTEFLRQALEAV